MSEIDPILITGLRAEFAEIDREAAQIQVQNRQYDSVPSCGRDESRINAQNRVSLVQESHVDLLREMSEVLPYEQLGIALVATHNEIRALEERLETVDEDRCTGILAVDALASRIANECYPALEAETEQAAEARRKAISEGKRAEIGSRLGELTALFGQLEAVVPEGTAWPIPKAKRVEVPESPFSPLVSPQNGDGPNGFDLEGTHLGETELHLVTDDAPIPETPEERLEEFLTTHKIYQPELSPLIAFYLKDNAGRSLDPDEIAEFVYSHVPAEELEGKNIRSRITSACGPIVKGQLIRALLDTEGYVLQYGMRYYLRPVNGSEQTKVVTKRRVYRAIPKVQVNGDIPQYRENFLVAQEIHGQPEELAAAA